MSPPHHTPRRLACIILPSSAMHGYLMHVATTAQEEVMGLILGDWKPLPPKPHRDSFVSIESADALGAEEYVAEVACLLVQRRLDKRPDRVELAPEQLIEATAEAEMWSKKTSRTVRVIGWYHSHPGITVNPSHVDLGTQETQQLMDDRFFGLIVSCFHAEADRTQKQRLVAFQTYTPTRTLISVPILHRPVAPGMDAMTRAMFHAVPKSLYSELADEYMRVAENARGRGAVQVVAGVQHIGDLMDLADKVIVPAKTVAAYHARQMTPASAKASGIGFVPVAASSTREVNDLIEL
ncbi:BRCA1 BRCA2-containing complex, subunit 3 [Allomyces arbusculus]|nr:BRCA1 BRCA2-containing complex, subunit 3 [Allomyces arbusculus]